MAAESGPSIRMHSDECEWPWSTPQTSHDPTMVEVEVGTEHKMNLAMYIKDAKGYFISALKPQWNKWRSAPDATGSGIHEKLKLPDDNPRAVALYIQWLSTGKIFSRRTVLDQRVDGEIRDLTNCHIFADKICHLEFKQDVMKCLREVTSEPFLGNRLWKPRACDLTYTTEHCPGKSDVIKLFDELFIQRSNAVEVSRIGEHQDKDLSIEILMKLFNKCKKELLAVREELLALRTFLEIPSEDSDADLYPQEDLL